jgi:nucleotide-binding universal stress UspA family protein
MDAIMAKIIVPLDGSKEGEAALPYVEHLASKLGARVILLQVLATGYIGLGYTYVAYTEQQIASDTVLAKEYLDKIASRLRVSGIQTELVLRQGNAAEEIVDLADKTSAGVVAMSTHGRSGIGRWVFGSVAEKVLHGGTKPLLLVRARSQSAVKSAR